MSSRLPAGTINAELKRRVALGVIGDKKAVETAVLKSLDEWTDCPDIEAGGVRLVDRSENELTVVIQVKFYDRSTKYYEVKVKEITT